MTDVTLRCVGILSPGDMGSAIGNVLRQTGLDVLTLLTGRSALTRDRALEAGFRDAGSIDDLVRESDLILSVLVPSEAVRIAEQVTAAMRRTGARPVFADCNAIAPQTVTRIDAMVREAGGCFIDAGIIGGPPAAPGSNTRFPCSGPDTAAFEALARHGLNVSVVGPRIGQASGLKMCYAASTKGTTALWTELMTAAHALGLEDALMAELGSGATSALRGIPGMPSKARRWVGEMEEIAATFAGVGLTPRIFEGAADMYRLVSATPLADQTPRDPNPTVDEVLDTLTRHLGE